MQNTFEQITDILNQLEQSLNAHNLPQIEKDIVLEKLRNLYMLAQTSHVSTASQPQNEQTYEVYQGITEDVDLFFDTDHESYNSPISAEPQEAEEEQRRLAEEQRKQAKEEEQRRLAEEQRKRDIPTDEDDLLQFMPKSAPTNTPTRSKTGTNQTTQQSTPPQRSLHDLFNAQQEDNSLSAQFQRSKVSDLTKAISINDKFTYIRELFNNKGEEFSATIQQLNQCQNLDDAFDCLENLKHKYYWDTTSTAYLSLCDLLRRKFS